jgi:hypothetical protein
MRWCSTLKGLCSLLALVSATVALYASGLSSPLSAQPSGPPNFAPDPNTAWVPQDNFDNFLAPVSAPGPVMVDPRFPFIQTGVGQQTDRIADLTNPILQPWVVEKLRETNDTVHAGKVPFVARERCWPGGVPGFSVYALLLPTRFLQTPMAIIIVNDLYAQIRHVYMNVPHTKDLKPSWYGESVGHWEGDELVIDTIGFNDRTFVDNFGTPHTDQLHVVERFKLIEGGNTLQATVTVEDPGAFNMPWTAIQRWRRGANEPWVERPCEESNAGYFGYDVVPIPQDDTPDF